MDLLKKLMGDGVPKWAQPLSPKSFKEFQAQVEATLVTLNINSDLNWDNGEATVGNNKIYFHNFIHQWREADTEGRANLVEYFLSSSFQSLGTHSDKIIDRLDDLLIRIYDLEMPHVQNFVNQPIGDFLYATLVLDSPTSTRSVSRNQLKESDLTLDELFVIAKKNLQAKVKPEIARSDISLGELTKVVAGNFGASFITILESATEGNETYWVATPNKHVLLLLKPAKRDEDSILEFLELANQYCSQLPNDYILPFVLEYKDGVFRDLCVRVDGGIELA